MKFREAWEAMGFNKDPAIKTASEIRRVKAWIESGGKCVYCGCSLMAFDTEDSRMVTVDHLKPRAHGGFFSERNLVAACHCCNSERGTRYPMKFIKSGGNRELMEAKLFELKWADYEYWKQYEDPEPYFEPKPKQLAPQDQNKPVLSSSPGQPASFKKSGRSRRWTSRELHAFWAAGGRI